MPLGYVGPVPVSMPTSEVSTPIVSGPPLGYVGPVPRPKNAVPTLVTIPLSGPAIPVALTASTPTFAAAPVAVRAAGASVAVASESAAPPLGYVGPAPSLPSFAPPIGYVGPVVSAERSALPVLPPALSYADELPAAHEGETLISATQMHADSENGIVTATGKVEIVRSDYILHADKVTYDQNSGVMTADGHVAILAPSGDVEFADHEQVTGDMKQAFAQNIGILFPDNSRMAGLTGQRFDERYTVIDRAMYTACNVCQKNPDTPPLWQLRADSITHDNVEHEVYYHDATIDFDDVPVLYTPYIAAPDPTVKRRQGFLSPMPGISPNIGEYIRTPYYVDIAPEKDMTITPTFSTKDKVQLDAQYRERFAEGKLQLEGSITQADLVNDNGINEGQQTRGHVFGTFVYDIDNTWRAGTDVQYASDKSYLPRYYISSLDQTTTRAYVEGFKGRDYAALNSYAFQDLRAGTDATEPFVLPSATISALGDPGQTLGGRWSFDGNSLITTRNNTGQTLVQQGPDTRRLSLNGGWQRQLISSTGLETTVSGLFRTDSYWANNIIANDGNGTVYNRALFTRQFEQGNAVMRYPMGRSGDGYQQLLEPIVAVTGAPDVRVIAKQPIEDSLDTEFDETNLFSPNRFTGSDLIEGGSRVTYGVRNALTADSGARLDVFGGESYDFTANSEFQDLSGLNSHPSDYVGRIDFEPAKWLNVNYGFRLAQDTFSPQRQDASASFGESVFRPTVRYIQAYQTDTTTNLVGQVRQVTVGFSSKFSKYWTLSGTQLQAFDPSPGPRNTSVSLAYVDECFAFGITGVKNYTNRADISSGTSVVFHVYLKNLGGSGTDSVSNIQFPAQFRQTSP
jgi:LPS-assembly protein